jgi:glutamine synthetase
VLNTIAAQAIDHMADALATKLDGGAELAEAVLEVVKDAYAANKQIIFNGDNYTDEWHTEAEQRGLLNLRQTPDALPYLVAEKSIEAFENYDVLSGREIHARYEVFVEQYITKLNIESETAASIARTMLVPAAVKYLGELAAAGESAGLGTIRSEVVGLLDDLVEKLGALDAANSGHPEGVDPLEAAVYVENNVVPAMEAVREVADELEGVVPDALWPLPKYSEILFIK